MSYYYYFARFIAAVHMVILGVNIVSIPLLIWKEEIWIWMPMITVLASPLLGGSYCMLNRLENYYRELAGMPVIDDRIEEFFRRD